MNVIEALVDPLRIAYAAVFFLSGVLCLLLIPRAKAFENAEIRTGLVWLLATTGSWGVLKTAYLLLPAPIAEPTYAIGLVIGFATVGAWLYFCSAYTARPFHRNPTLRRLSVAVFGLVAVVKLTNPLHGLYFTATEATDPFPHLAIEHGLLHWSATGLAYVLAAIGLFMLFELYIRSAYDTRPLSVLAGLIALPVVFDIIAVSTPRFINFIYAPIGVAIFAVGVLVVFQERLAAVSTALPDGTASVYLDDDRRIQDASEAARDLFPALEHATGKPIADVLPAVADHLESPGAILEQGDEPRYYLLETNPVRLVGSAAQVLTFTDVTELERTRRDLREKERELSTQNELYRAILSASFAFVYRVDTDRSLTFVSEPVAEVLGYDPDMLVGEPIDVVAPTDDVAEQARQYTDDVLAGEAIRLRDFPLQHRDGREVFVDIQVVPIYDPSVAESERTADDTVGAQGMVRETTDRHRREALISVINRVLRHNVRNELTVINGRAAMLAEELDGQPAASAEKIVAAGNRLLNLSESARKIEQSREQSPELASHDIVPMLETAVEQIEDQYPTATLSVDSPTEAMVLTKPRVTTAISELLDNAAKHSGDAPTINIKVTTDPDWVTVTIVDDGPGLPDGEREVLRTGAEDPLAHGSGLGLWLANWIVTTLDGDIEILDTVNGTTVEIRLPNANT